MIGAMLAILSIGSGSRSSLDSARLHGSPTCFSEALLLGKLRGEIRIHCGTMLQSTPAAIFRIDYACASIHRGVIGAG